MINLKVAPSELIRRDFQHLKETEELDTTDEIAELLFVQSLEGRAHNGAGAFQKSFYVNTTIDDIVHALKLDPNKVKSKRQALIDDIAGFVDDTIKGKPRPRLVNSRGEPFIGVPDLKEIEVNSLDVLRGIYIGGLRDDPGPRAAAEEKFDITIGYGKCYPINIDVMDKMNFDGELLAHREHAGSIEAFKRAGLIIAEGDLKKVAPEKIRYLYIRHKIGPGQSDDGALVAAGMIYNKSVALGVFLADAIDTLEKYVHLYKDQDDELGYYISKNCRDLNVSMDEVLEMTYLAAVPEELDDIMPDSSLRYFLSIDRQVGQCALQSHLNFIEKKPYFPMFISFNRTLSTEFYTYIRNKVNSLKNLQAVVTSDTVMKGLEMPVNSFLKSPAIVVKSGVPLKDALEKMKAAGAEFLVIQDESNAVQGVISLHDLLELMMKNGRQG
ncbi:MAG: CBS domain-containing protein [Candidatus Omnitrophica bacterium]|nr:CBS domain-containing protein [Candidatus Omnitrophota bacterium]